MSAALLPEARVLAKLALHDTLLRLPLKAGHPHPTSLSILSAILEFGPSGAQCILSQLERSPAEEGVTLVDLASHWYQLVLFFKAALGTTPHNRSPASESEDGIVIIPPSRQQQESLKAALRVREGWVCVGPSLPGSNNSWYDQEAPAAIDEALETAGLWPIKSIAAHIVPFAAALTDQDLGTPRATKKRDFSASLSAFMGSELLSVLQSGVNGINSPSNALLLCSSFHGSFCALQAILEPDSSTGVPNSYQLFQLKGSRLASQNDQTRSITTLFLGTFTFVSNGDIAVPSPLYLATHAAVAKVFHASGIAALLKDFRREEHAVDQVEAGERDKGVNSHELEDRLFLADMSMSL